MPTIGNKTISAPQSWTWHPASTHPVSMIFSLCSSIVCKMPMNPCSGTDIKPLFLLINKTRTKKFSPVYGSMKSEITETSPHHLSSEKRYSIVLFSAINIS